MTNDEILMTAEVLSREKDLSKVVIFEASEAALAVRDAGHAEMQAMTSAPSTASARATAPLRAAFPFARSGSLARGRRPPMPADRGDQRHPRRVRAELVHPTVRCAERVARRFAFAAFHTDPHRRRGAGA